jgi:hypothetical protein
MAIRNTNFPDSADINYANAFVFRNVVSEPSGSMLSTAQDGVVGDDTGILNSRYDLLRTPSGLGSGVFVDSTGRYLYSNEYSIDGEPIKLFTVVNVGNDSIYAGINIDSSGWSLDKGLVIESGASFTFGGEESQVIRNVWAVCDTSDSSRVGGYATNLDSWSV